MNYINLSRVKKIIKKLVDFFNSPVKISLDIERLIPLIFFLVLFVDLFILQLQYRYDY